jgi:hypothetical protein
MVVFFLLSLVFSFCQSRYPFDLDLQANDDFGCQSWRQHNRALVHAWACDNLHYITDLDSQADIAALQQGGIDLRWPDVSAP